MVLLENKEDEEEPYVPRKDFNGKIETRSVMIGKSVEFEAQTGDDEGLIRDFNPNTGLCKVQFFKSNKIITVRRDKFETSENLIRKREKRAREAVEEYTDKLAAENIEAQAGHTEWTESVDDSSAAGTQKGAESRALSRQAGGGGDSGSPDYAAGGELLQNAPATVTATASSENGGLVTASRNEDRINHEDEGNSKGVRDGAEEKEGEGDGEEEAPDLGEFGASYLGGDERYQRIALKYDGFRSYLKELRQQKGCRKQGPSVLDDLETIGSEPSGGGGGKAVGKQLDSDVVEKAARSAKEQVLHGRDPQPDDLSAVTPATQLSSWTFGTLNKQNAAHDRADQVGADVLTHQHRHLAKHVRYRVKRRPRVEARKRLALKREAEEVEQEKARKQALASMRGGVFDDDGHEGVNSKAYQTFQSFGKGNAAAAAAAATPPLGESDAGALRGEGGGGGGGGGGGAKRGTAGPAASAASSSSALTGCFPGEEEELLVAFRRLATREDRAGSDALSGGGVALDDGSVVSHLEDGSVAFEASPSRATVAFAACNGGGATGAGAAMFGSLLPPPDRAPTGYHMAAAVAADSSKEDYEGARFALPASPVDHRNDGAGSNGGNGGSGVDDERSWIGSAPVRLGFTRGLATTEEAAGAGNTTKPGGGGGGGVADGDDDDDVFRGSTNGDRTSNGVEVPVKRWGSTTGLVGGGCGGDSYGQAAAEGAGSLDGGGTNNGLGDGEEEGVNGGDGFGFGFNDGFDDDGFDDADAYDYVFPIAIQKHEDGRCVTSWQAGSDVEIALNKGDSAKEVALKFVILHNLPGAVTDSVQKFLEATVRPDPSAAFARPIKAIHTQRQQKQQQQSKQLSLAAAASPSSRALGAASPLSLGGGDNEDNGDGEGGSSDEDESEEEYSSDEGGGDDGGGGGCGGKSGGVAGDVSGGRTVNGGKREKKHKKSSGGGGEDTREGGTSSKSKTPVRSVSSSRASSRERTQQQQQQQLELGGDEKQQTPPLRSGLAAAAQAQAEAIDKTVVKLSRAELEAAEKAEAKSLEEATRRPRAEGGTPLEHPKRHPLFGARGGCGGVGGGEEGGVGLAMTTASAKRAKQEQQRRKRREAGEDGNGGSGGDDGDGGTGKGKKKGGGTGDDGEGGGSSGGGGGSDDGDGEENSSAAAAGAAAEARSQAQPEYGAESAFMVLATLRTGIHDKSRVAVALSALLHGVTQTNEGCARLREHGVVQALLRAQSTHAMDVNVQVLVCLVFRELLKRCEPLRRLAVVVHTVRGILDRNRNLMQVVECAVDAFRLMGQASCASASVEDDVVKDLDFLDLMLGLAQLRAHRREPKIVLPVLRFCALVVALRLRPAVRRFVEAGGVELSLATLQRHSGNLQLMTAALRMLVVAAKVDGDAATGGPSKTRGVADRLVNTRLPPWPEEMKERALYERGGSEEDEEEALKEELAAGAAGDEKASTEDEEAVSEAAVVSRHKHSSTAAAAAALPALHPVEVILKTMMRLHADKKLQLGGTELIQTLLEGEGEEGDDDGNGAKAALAAIPGGIDWLCQGPEEGNVLIHWRGGHLQNPGWACGEQPYHTGTAAEHLWSGAQALAQADRGAGEGYMYEAIQADELGAPSQDSVHAHYELAAMHHVVREYDEAEFHFDKALKRTSADLKAALAKVSKEQTTIRAAGGSVDVGGGGGATTTSLPPIGSGGNSGSSSGGSGVGSGRSSGGGGAAAGASSASSSLLDRARGRLVKAQAEASAAETRRNALVLSRNMLRKDRGQGATHSAPLELWTAEKLRPFLPQKRPLSPKAAAAEAARRGALPPHARKVYDASVAAEPHPLRLPPVLGTSAPPHWAMFDEANLKRQFSVIKRLGLLPMYGESVAEWQARVARWERETGTPVASLALVERDLAFPGLFPV